MKIWAIYIVCLFFLCCLVRFGVWVYGESSRPIAGGIDIVTRGTEEVVYYLPNNTEPNDYTWRALDCNVPLKVVDSNGIEFAVIPEPL